jgi:hypothetical protein
MRATSFLRRIEADDTLRAAVAAAYGDVPRILDLADAHGYRITVEELDRARLQLYGPATREEAARSDYSHPAVYFTEPGASAGDALPAAGTPDYAHPAVYFC